MAINKIVLKSPDGRIRISTSHSGATAIRVEKDSVLVAILTSLPLLESWLREQGLELADLQEDQ